MQAALHEPENLAALRHALRRVSRAAESALAVITDEDVENYWRS